MSLLFIPYKGYEAWLSRTHTVANRCHECREEFHSKVLQSVRRRTSGGQALLLSDASWNSIVQVMAKRGSLPASEPKMVR